MALTDEDDVYLVSILASWLFSSKAGAKYTAGIILRILEFEYVATYLFNINARGTDS